MAQNDIKLYTELLEETQAGYKAVEDVKILENTKNIRTLDIKLNNLNIQNQIVSLYF